MSVTPQPRPTREPYPIATMQRVRELHEGGWPPSRIRRFLADEGHDVPSRTTIYEWVNAEYKARQMRAKRDQKAARLATRTEFRLRHTRPESQHAFMVRLRREGVPCATIAKVCGVVFGVRLSAGEVRERLRDVSPPHGNRGKGRPRTAVA